MIDNIFNGMLPIVAFFIDSLLSEARFYDIKFAEMPAAFTILTAAVLLVMMGEVTIGQM